MAVVLAWSSVGRATVDLTNRWFLTIDETQPGGSYRAFCDVELVQVGGNVTTSSPGVCGGGTLEFEGTVDAQSGALAWHGSYATYDATPFVREFTFTGTAAASGSTFTGGALGPQLVAELTGSLCRNGKLDPGEQCDGSACCSAECTFAADGTACAGACFRTTGTCSAGVCTAPRKPPGTMCDVDGSPCTSDTCDASGECVPGPCSACCGGPACEPMVRDGCADPGTRATPFHAKITSGPGDLLQFAMTRPPAIDVGVLGDPLTTTDYDLCIYHFGPLPPAGVRPWALANVHVPAGGTCAGKPCWRRHANGAVEYRNPHRERNGVSSLRVTPGDSGRARLALKGRGSDLPLPPSLGRFVNGKVLVQVMNPLACWEALYDLNTEPGAINATRELRARRATGY